MTGSPESVAQEVFAAEGLTPHVWSNQAGYRYPEHSHPYHKVLYCVAGSITFHTPDGDIRRTPGDRVDLPAGTLHSATVGPDGVTCLEAAKEG